MFDLGPRARVVFAVGYVVGQLGLVSYGMSRPDDVFGFQMFNESSKIRLRLFRRVRGSEQLVPVRNGTWRADDAAGVAHRFRWTDRVRYHTLAHPDVFVHASYGLDTQLFRLQQALNDVASHIPEDRETVELVAVVDTIRNGRPQEPVRLVGARP